MLKAPYKYEVYFRGTFYAYDYFGFSTKKEVMEKLLSEGFRKCEITSIHAVENKPDYSYF